MIRRSCPFCLTWAGWWPCGRSGSGRRSGGICAHESIMHCRCRFEKKTVIEVRHLCKTGAVGRHRHLNRATEVMLTHPRQGGGCPQDRPDNASHDLRPVQYGSRRRVRLGWATSNIRRARTPRKGLDRSHWWCLRFRRRDSLASPVRFTSTRFFRPGPSTLSIFLGPHLSSSSRP